MAALQLLDSRAGADAIAGPIPRRAEPTSGARGEQRPARLLAMSSLRRWLRPPLAEDPEEALRARITHWIILSAMVSVSLLIAALPVASTNRGLSPPHRAPRDLT